jgi:hypothetical protein
MQWTEDTSDDTLKLRKLPDGLQLQLVIEGHQIVLDDKALAKPATQSSGTNPSTLNTVGASNPFAATSATDANGNALSANSTAVGAGAAGSGLGGAAGSSGSSLSSGSSTASSSSSSSSGSLNSTQVNTYTPQVMLFSNGDTNSFALTLSREGSNRSVTLQSSDDGTVQVGDVVEPKS